MKSFDSKYYNTINVLVLHLTRQYIESRNYYKQGELRFKIERFFYYKRRMKRQRSRLIALRKLRKTLLKHQNRTSSPLETMVKYLNFKQSLRTLLASNFQTLYTYTLKRKIIQKQQKIVLLLKRIKAKVFKNIEKKSIISTIQKFKQIVEKLKNKKIRYRKKYRLRLLLAKKRQDIALKKKISKLKIGKKHTKKLKVGSKYIKKPKRRKQKFLFKRWKRWKRVYLKKRFDFLTYLKAEIKAKSYVKKEPYIWVPTKKITKKYSASKYKGKYIPKYHRNLRLWNLYRDTNTQYLISRKSPLANLKSLKNKRIQIPTYINEVIETEKINVNIKLRLFILKKKRRYLVYLSKKFRQLHKISKELKIKQYSFIKSKKYNPAIKTPTYSTIIFKQSVKNKIVNKKILSNNIKNIVKSNRRTIRTVEKRITKDFSKRKLYLKYEKNRIVLKALNMNAKIPQIIQKNIYSKLLTFPKNSNKTRIRNRCVLTGRGRAVYRDFKISRLMLRSLANFGVLPGVSKATW